MEQAKKELENKYSDAERRLSKKDYVGNILYLPYDPDGQYFYSVDPTQRARLIDQLNVEFDVQEKLSVSKRTSMIEVKFGKDEPPLPVCVFARWSKGKSQKITITVARIKNRILF